ncbi:hypothetical protein [Pontibacter mangrovi]|uniref:Uncharacterized protein n=1 Tax=Pontibacter mangrovi TaxID=2589816 RepID=A0A501W9U6_9BACT|nr:hypothetical protein [Pontibacter mangrovi]TPE43597.1 hypothetical protein FJM65_12640 [Pontibacter mangrovi]
MTILNNEQVYKDKDITIHKLYCPQKQLFGLSLQSKDGRKDLHPAYKSIIKFFTNGMGVAITPEGQYLWVDRDLNLSQMSMNDETMISALYVPNSVCNCVGTTEEAECNLCVNGIIRNAENFRRLQHAEHLTYEYETHLGAYRITLHEEKSITTVYNYLWRICDMEDALQEMIDEAEKREKACNDRIVQLCIVEDLGEEAHFRILLKSYRAEIEVIDTSLSLDVVDKRIYLDI